MNVRKRLEKKGISPVIATVLLVAMVIVIALIIFLWFKSLSQEAITKFGENVQLTCQKVSFSADYANGAISITNNGNVPIYDIDVKISTGGNYNTDNLSAMSGNWPKGGIRQGGTFQSGDLSSQISGATQLTLIPVLLGTSNNGQQTYACDQQYGQILNV